MERVKALETKPLKEHAEWSFYQQKYKEARRWIASLREGSTLYQELKLQFDRYIYRKSKVLSVLRSRIVDLERLMRKTRTQLFSLKKND